MPLFDHAGALGHIRQHRLDDLHRRRMVLFAFGALFQHHHSALARGLSAHGHILGHFAPGQARPHQGINAGTQHLCHMTPGKTEHQGSPQHQDHDAQQARARKTQPFHTGRPHDVAQHAPRMPRQQRFEAVKARPFQRRTGAHEQRQPTPEQRTARGGACGTHHRFAATHPARQRSNPGTHPCRHTPPHRKSEHEIAAVSQPGTKPPCPIGHQPVAARARGGPRSVLCGIAGQRQQPENQRQQAHDKAYFVAEAGCTGAGCRPGRRRSIQGIE